MAPFKGYRFKGKTAPEGAEPIDDQLMKTAGFTTGDLRVWQFENAIKKDSSVKFTDFFKDNKPNYGVMSLD